MTVFFNIPDLQIFGTLVPKLWYFGIPKFWYQSFDHFLIIFWSFGHFFDANCQLWLVVGLQQGRSYLQVMDASVCEVQHVDLCPSAYVERVAALLVVHADVVLRCFEVKPGGL